MEKSTEVQNYIKSFVRSNFPPKRVICLIAYGSSLSNSENDPEDYDFLLLLDKYHKSDYKILKKASEKWPLDLFIDYQDQILRKGFNKYQRGRHGTYFFACLASAKCLINKNFYALNVDKISRGSIKNDLLYRVEEYFYRIQKNYIRGKNDQKTLELIRKYLSRICMDLLLFTGEMRFSEVNTVHYTDAIETKVLPSRIFSQQAKELLDKFFKCENVDLALDVVESLYETYLNCFESLKEKINHNDC